MRHDGGLSGGPLTRFYYGSRSIVALLAVVLAASSAQAAPPEVPPLLAAKVGKPLVFKVKYEAGKNFSYAAGYDETKCPVFRLQTDDTTTATFLALPDTAGEFYITFWTRGEKETGHSQVVISASDTGKLPTDPPPKKPTDPPAPTTSLYFLLVRPDGPAQPAFTQSLLWPEWVTLALKGHSYKDKTLAEAAKLGAKIPAGTPLPCVVVLRVRTGGTTSEQLGIAPYPSSGTDVSKLPDLFK